MLQSVKKNTSKGAPKLRQMAKFSTFPGKNAPRPPTWISFSTNHISTKFLQPFREAQLKLRHAGLMLTTYFVRLIHR